MNASYRTTLALAGIALAARAGGASAQVPQQQAPQPSTMQMVLKGKAPVSKDILKVKLPRATEADLDDRIAELAKKRNADPDQVYASLQKAGRLKEIEQGLTEEKVFKWLLERNTVE